MGDIVDFLQKLAAAQQTAAQDMHGKVQPSEFLNPMPGTPGMAAPRAANSNVPSTALGQQSSGVRAALEDMRARLMGREDAPQPPGGYNPSAPVSNTGSLSAYFKPGNIVPSYGGRDRVLEFNPGDLNGRWAAKVQAVGPDGAPLQGMYGSPRWHSTPPTLGELNSATMKPQQSLVPRPERAGMRVPQIRDQNHLNQLLNKAEGDADLRAISQQMQKQGLDTSGLGID